MLDFVALDFETANKFKNSACSLAVITVKDGQIIKKAYSLIKPPFMSFDDECIEIHGIQPKDVIHEKTFDQLWNAIYENHLKREYHGSSQCKIRYECIACYTGLL